MENYGSFKSFGFICIYKLKSEFLFYNADVLKIKMTWKIMGASKVSVIYIYSFYNADVLKIKMTWKIVGASKALIIIFMVVLLIFLFLQFKLI